MKMKQKIPTKVSMKMVTKMHEYSDENDRPNRCPGCNGVLAQEKVAKLMGAEVQVKCVNDNCLIDIYKRFDYDFE